MPQSIIPARPQCARTARLRGTSPVCGCLSDFCRLFNRKICIRGVRRSDLPAAAANRCGNRCDAGKIYIFQKRPEQFFSCSGTRFDRKCIYRELIYIITKSHDLQPADHDFRHAYNLLYAFKHEIPFRRLSNRHISLHFL